MWDCQNSSHNTVATFRSNFSKFLPSAVCCVVVSGVALCCGCFVCGRLLCWRQGAEGLGAAGVQAVGLVGGGGLAHGMAAAGGGAAVGASAELGCVWNWNPRIWTRYFLLMGLLFPFSSLSNYYNILYNDISHCSILYVLYLKLLIWARKNMRSVSVQLMNNYICKFLGVPSQN